MLIQIVEKNNNIKNSNNMKKFWITVIVLIILTVSILVIPFSTFSYDDVYMFVERVIESK